MSESRTLVLGLLPGGIWRNWKEPDSRADEALRLSLYRDIAQRAEAAKIHTLFLADGVTVDRQDPKPSLEPVTLLSALAAVTERIGLVGSISTSFTEPFNVARQVASLDHISGGRAGWNIVTSAWGERNFGRDPLPPHDERYEIAEEFTQVVTRLWESWDADAVVRDVGRDLFVDPERIHAIDHDGVHFAVEGPLNTARTPQDRPILAQAGSSEAGRDFGARHADVIFTTGLIDVEESRAIYRDIRRRAVEQGRAADAVKILPGVAPVIGSTEEEARRLWEDSLSDHDLERGRESLSKQFGEFDLAAIDYDEPFPLDLLPDEEEVQGRRSRYGVLKSLLLTGRAKTLRDLILYHSSAGGHWFPIGTAEQVADQFEDRFRTGAADGFNLLGFFQNYRGGFEAITEGLIPELRRRGIFHHDYEHETLRENLGLPLPIPR